MVRGSRLTDGVDRGGLREVRAPKPRLSWFAPTTGWFPRRRRRSPFFGVGFARAAAAGERLLFLICLRTRARSLSLSLSPVRGCSVSLSFARRHSRIAEEVLEE